MVVGTAPCAQPPPEGSGPRSGSSTPRPGPGSGGTGSGTAQASGKQGFRHFPVCTKPETKNLPPPCTRTFANHTFISSYKHTHTHTHKRKSQEAPGTHTLKSSDHTHSSAATAQLQLGTSVLLGPQNCLQPKVPFLPQTQVVSVCLLAGRCRRTPGALPTGRQRWKRLVLLSNNHFRWSPELRESLFEGGCTPGGKCPSAPAGKEVSGHSQDSRLLPCRDRKGEVAPQQRQARRKTWRGRAGGLLADIIENTSLRRKKGPLWARRQT